MTAASEQVPRDDYDRATITCPHCRTTVGVDVAERPDVRGDADVVAALWGAHPPHLCIAATMAHRNAHGVDPTPEAYPPMPDDVAPTGQPAPEGPVTIPTGPDAGSGQLSPNPDPPRARTRSSYCSSNHHVRCKGAVSAQLGGGDCGCWCHDQPDHHPEAAGGLQRDPYHPPTRPPSNTRSLGGRSAECTNHHHSGCVSPHCYCPCHPMLRGDT